LKRRLNSRHPYLQSTPVPPPLTKEGTRNINRETVASLKRRLNSRHLYLQSTPIFPPLTKEGARLAQSQHPVGSERIMQKL